MTGDAKATPNTAPESVPCAYCGVPSGQACMNGMREEPYPSGVYHTARKEQYHHANENTIAAQGAAIRNLKAEVKRLHDLLRRYHERVTAADKVLAGLIASRSYLNDAMSNLPHPTIGDEVTAALAKIDAALKEATS